LYMSHTKRGNIVRRQTTNIHQQRLLLVTNCSLGWQLLFYVYQFCSHLLVHRQIIFITTSSEIITSIKLITRYISVHDLRRPLTVPPAGDKLPASPVSRSIHPYFKIK